MPFKILFVCMANVCRSPMARAVLQDLTRRRGGPPVEVDAAGVRVASSRLRPDPRAQAALLRRGYAVPGGRSRRLAQDDFERCDLLLAMDRLVLDDMLRQCPQQHRAKVRLFLDFAEGQERREVPDPYFGDAAGFDLVLDLCEAGALGLQQALWDGTAFGRRA